MSNLILSMTALVISVLTGIVFSLRLQKKETILRKLILFTEEMSVHIRYQALEIPVLLWNMSQQSEYAELEFLAKTAEMSGENGDFHRAWEKNADEIPHLSQSEREIVKSIGNGLGRTDTEGQISMLALNSTLLKEKYEKAHEEYTRKGKMYRSVGVLAGIGLAIMFF